MATVGNRHSETDINLLTFYRMTKLIIDVTFLVTSLPYDITTTTQGKAKHRYFILDNWLLNE